MNSTEKEFQLISNLKLEQSIPDDYYGNQFGYSAKNLSPLLEWKNPPAGTKSFAVTVYDPDAPTGSGWWHYLLFDIPANVSRIEQGDLSSREFPNGAVESMTDTGKPGYLGPCPPPGQEHRYIFTVHALKVEKLDVPPTATPAYVGFNLWANGLGKASFMVRGGRIG